VLPRKRFQRIIGLVTLMNPTAPHSVPHCGATLEGASMHGY
jgi:hypothetical protein